MCKGLTRAPFSTSCVVGSRQRCLGRGSERRMTKEPWQPSAARPEPARRMLIVGATGVLRPAALMCAGAGWTVLALEKYPQLQALTLP